MSARLTRQAICLMLGFAVAACAPGQPSATGPAASIGLGASSSPAAAQPQDLGAAEVSLRQDDRTRAGLVNLGPVAPELAGRMDASGAHALQDAVTWTQTLIAGPTSPAPTGRLVSDTIPGTAIFARRAIATGGYEGLMSEGVAGTRLTNDEDTLGGCSGFGLCSDPAPVKPPSEMSGTYTDPHYCWRPSGRLMPPPRIGPVGGAQRPKRRFAAIEVMAAEGCSVQVACRVLAVSQSGFYAQRHRPPSARVIRDAALTDVIARVHADSRGTYGGRRVNAELVWGMASLSATARWRCSCVERGSPAWGCSVMSVTHSRSRSSRPKRRSTKSVAVAVPPIRRKRGRPNTGRRPSMAMPSAGVRARLGVVPAHVVDKMRALVLGLGLSKLQTEGGLSCSVVRRSSRQPIVSS